MAAFPHYCAIQSQLYAVVRGDEPASSIDADAALSARLAVLNILAASDGMLRRARSPYAPRETASSAGPEGPGLRDMLVNLDDIAHGLARSGGCPYWTCKRFK